MKSKKSLEEISDGRIYGKSRYWWLWRLQYLLLLCWRSCCT